MITTIKVELDKDLSRCATDSITNKEIDELRFTGDPHEVSNAIDNKCKQLNTQIANNLFDDLTKMGDSNVVLAYAGQGSEYNIANDAYLMTAWYSLTPAKTYGPRMSPTFYTDDPPSPITGDAPITFIQAKSLLKLDKNDIPQYLREIICIASKILSDSNPNDMRIRVRKAVRLLTGALVTSTNVMNPRNESARTVGLSIEA